MWLQAPGPRVRPIYLCPVTINCQLVLEAETLIADYLKETGKARFIIDDDESTTFTAITGARYSSYQSCSVAALASLKIAWVRSQPRISTPLSANILAMRGNTS